MIGRWVDDTFASVTIAIGNWVKWLADVLEDRSRNHPTDLSDQYPPLNCHACGSLVRAGDASFGYCGDCAAQQDWPDFDGMPAGFVPCVREPAGSVVRDAPASAGVAVEDVPQNQPSTRFTPLPVDEPCDMGAQPVGEHLDPKLLRATNPIYRDLEDRFRSNQK